MTKPRSLAYLRARTALVASVTLLAALVGFLSPSPRDLYPPPTSALLFPRALLERSPLDGRVFSREDGAYAFGRWRQPGEDLSFHSDAEEGTAAALSNLLRTKAWHYSSFNSDRFFIGMAILGYLSDAFVYVVDKRSADPEKFEFSGRFPGSVGLTFASSSIDDSACTSFRSFGADELSVCYRSDSREWEVRVNATLVGERSRKQKQLMTQLFMERQEALALLFPLGNDNMRPAYVHKAAGSPVRGVIAFGDDEEQLEEHASDKSRVGLGAIDWTRSHALRCTRWKWASSSFRTNVTIATIDEDGSSETAVTEEVAIGINFSSDVYDIDGESMENAVWINGVVYLLRGVAFSVPEQHLAQEWTIKSQAASDDERVDLRFSPLGSREDHTNLLVITSEFVQPFGTFHGSVRFSTPDGRRRVSIDVQDAFGVVENHFATW